MISWSYLYGFPGEEESDYKPIIEQFPALHHLPPPGGANRIAIERFSPYFDKPELGFADIKPAKMYSIIYDLPESELKDLAYVFDAPALGVTDAIGRELDQDDRAVAASVLRTAESRLTYA